MIFCRSWQSGNSFGKFAEQYFLFQVVRAAEDVAAHPPLLRGGEERPRAGGRAGQEGIAIQAPGKQLLM